MTIWLGDPSYYVNSGYYTTFTSGTISTSEPIAPTVDQNSMYIPATWNDTPPPSPFIEMDTPEIDASSMIVVRINVGTLGVEDLVAHVQRVRDQVIHNGKFMGRVPEEHVIFIPQQNMPEPIRFEIHKMAPREDRAPQVAVTAPIEEKALTIDRDLSEFDID